ncbi:MAG TPA: hypothetical protein VFO36_03590, partial [Nitrospiraceae bacterium]|nr:hypothetical protein [Nitrospiraceae bacterium]
LFIVAQDVDDDVRASVREFVRQLAPLRNWLNGPPRFVHSKERPADRSRGDMPVETVGAYLDIYSASPPLMLPREIDLQHLEEVTTLVDAVRDFSRETTLEFEFELDGNFIGAVADGEMDRSLSEGLLDEWKRQLGT